MFGIPTIYCLSRASCSISGIMEFGLCLNDALVIGLSVVMGRFELVPDSGTASLAKCGWFTLCRFWIYPSEGGLGLAPF